MRPPTGEFREFLKAAERLGFVYAGIDGRSHPRLYNSDTGDCVSVPATPGDRRWRANAVARLERISGRKLPRQNSGKHHHHRQSQLDTTLSPAEKQASAQVEALLEEATSMRRRIEDLATNPSRNAALEARRVLAEYEHIRAQLERLHRIIPPIAE